MENLTDQQKRVVECRKKNPSWSQKKIADALNVSSGYVSQTLRNHYTPDDSFLDELSSEETIRLYFKADFYKSDNSKDFFECHKRFDDEPISLAQANVLHESFERDTILDELTCLSRGDIPLHETLDVDLEHQDLHDALGHRYYFESGTETLPWARTPYSMEPDGKFDRDSVAVDSIVYFIERCPSLDDVRQNVDAWKEKERLARLAPRTHGILSKPWREWAVGLPPCDNNRARIEASNRTGRRPLQWGLLVSAEHPENPNRQNAYLDQLHRAQKAMGG